MNSKWLFSGAFAFEASSWALLFANLPVAAAALAFAAAHAAAAPCWQGAPGCCCPGATSAPLPWSPLFLFALAFFIPLLARPG